MSVYTTIEQHELEQFLQGYDVGTLVSYEGISAGIENTNYFVTTTANEFVLTIFESHSAEEMPYFLDLMGHLSEHGVPSAHPIADKQQQTLQYLKGKPAALVQRLKGASITETTVDHCTQIGTMLGQLHTAGMSFPQHHDNPRGPHWWKETISLLDDRLDYNDLQLLQQEIHYQVDQSHADIPRGVIHADLFRDNALWHDDQLSGVIDFYFACNDALLYDVAVTVNDWCNNVDLSLDFVKVNALVKAYHQARPLGMVEKNLWPVMLRAGALRFWLSRLKALHFPVEGEITHLKDPDEFKNILIQRQQQQDEILANWV